MKESHLSAFQAPLSWAVSIPWPTAKAILRALEPEPSKRYQSMDAFSQAPQSIVAEIKLDPQLKKESEIQVKAWEAAQQQARQEAEEAVRLEALEKARREIDEELQRQESNREAQLSTPLEKPLERPLEAPPGKAIEKTPKEQLDESPLAISRITSRSRTARTSVMRGGWLVVTLLCILVALAVLWWANNFSIDKNLATVTPTQTALSASDTPTLSISPTSEATVTPSATFTKTATHTKSSTPTRTPTITRTNTVTPTASSTKTPTRTPKDEDTSIGASPLTRPLIQTANP